MNHGKLINRADMKFKKHFLPGDTADGFKRRIRKYLINFDGELGCTCKKSDTARKALFVIPATACRLSFSGGAKPESCLLNKLQTHGPLLLQG